MAGKEPMEMEEIDLEKSKYQQCMERDWTMARIVIIVSGIFVCFGWFAYVQEAVYRLGEPGDKFTYRCFLVFDMCIFNLTVAFLAILIKERGRPMQSLGKLDKFALQRIGLSSVTYSYAMITTNAALLHVNYPTQVIMKSAKMVPIVVGGWLIFRKTYRWNDYTTVGMVTLSLVVYGLNSDYKGKDVNKPWLGYLLLIIALICDACTGPIQDNLLKKKPWINSLTLMFTTNAYGVMICLLSSLAIENIQPWLFIARYPYSIKYFIAYGLMGAFGQLFIFASLIWFGALYTSLFATVRKALSTIISIYVFGHYMKPIQWACMAVLFSTLIFQSIVASKHKRAAAAKKAAEQQNAIEAQETMQSQETLLQQKGGDVLPPKA